MIVTRYSNKEKPYSSAECKKMFSKESDLKLHEICCLKNIKPQNHTFAFVRSPKLACTNVVSQQKQKRKTALPVQWDFFIHDPYINGS